MDKDAGVIWVQAGREKSVKAKTATPVDVPTYTFPLATMGVMNLLLLKLSFPFGAWLELWSSLARLVTS